MDLQEVGGGCEDWMELAQDRVKWRGTCEYGDEPWDSKNAVNFLTSCRTSQLLKKVSAPWSKYVSKYEQTHTHAPGFTDRILVPGTKI